METSISLPNGTSLFRRGHVLTLGGFWDTDLLDELEFGLNGLRSVLPRTRGEKFVTLHLFNFSITANAVSLALSLVRRTFIEDTTQVAVVAECTLGEAGLLFLAGSQRKHRKIFADSTVELRLRPREARAVGFDVAPDKQEITPPAELRLLPPQWQQTLLSNGALTPSVLDLPGAGLVDKLLPRA